MTEIVKVVSGGGQTLHFRGGHGAACRGRPPPPRRFPRRTSMMVTRRAFAANRALTSLIHDQISRDGHENYPLQITTQGPNYAHIRISAALGGFRNCGPKKPPKINKFEANIQSTIHTIQLDV